ncbi:MAG: prefoldin subunit alpha [Euryarchaeota archaeon]|nr:prefoldin subunit alpha [Euryarchaeota archaeon]
MSAPEAELRRAVASLELIRAQMDALARQEDLLRVTLEEIVRARESLTRLQQGGVGAELLMPIGANSFVYGTLKNAERVIVGIGSDVAVELEIPAAVERLDERMKAIEDVERGLAGRMAELEVAAQEHNARVQELYAKAQGAPPG